MSNIEIKPILIGESDSQHLLFSINIINKTSQNIKIDEMYLLINDSDGEDFKYDYKPFITNMQKIDWGSYDEY